MNTAGPKAGFRHSLAGFGHRLIAFADEPSDDDDVRLRKRVGVIGGYILVLLPLQLPILAQVHPLSWLLATIMPVVSALNLLHWHVHVGLSATSTS